MTAHSQSAFPLTQAASLLTLAATLLLAGGFVVTRYIAPSTHGLDAVLFAGLVVWLASIVGLIPVAVVGRRGVMHTVYAYFIGMVLRLALTLGAAALAVRAQHIEGKPLAMALGAFYVPLLFVEIAVIGRYLWNKDLPDTQAGPSSEPTA